MIPEAQVLLNTWIQILWALAPVAALVCALRIRYTIKTVAIIGKGQDSAVRQIRVSALVLTIILTLASLYHYCL